MEKNFNSRWLHINKEYVLESFWVKTEFQIIKIYLSDTHILQFTSQRFTKDDKVKKYAINDNYTNTIKLFIMDDMEYNIYNRVNGETLKIKGKDLIKQLPKQAIENFANKILGSAK